MSQSQQRRCFHVNMLFWVVIACIALTTIKGGANDNGGENRDSVVALQKECLGWIPPRTETTVAVKGPFAVVARDLSAKTEPFAHQLEAAALAPLFAIREGKYGHALRGETVLLALEGAFHFRAPFREGVSLYDGCHILVFDGKFAAVGDEFMRTVKEDSDRTYESSRHAVFAFDEEWSDNRWELLICRPRIDVLLVATSRNYLSSVLSAMERDSNERQAWQKVRADLPEWEHLDLQARFWAFRHYDPGNSTHDITSPLLRTDLSGLLESDGIRDPKAVGMTFSYDPAKPRIAQIRYLSPNPERANIVKRRWLMPDKTTAVIQESNQNRVDIAFELDSPPKAEQFLYLLAAELGHGLSL